MNRIVKAFIISLVLSVVLVVSCRYIMKMEEESHSMALHQIKKKTAPSYAARGTLLLPPGHPGTAATIEVIKKRIAPLCSRLTIETKNSSSYSLSATGIDDPTLFKELLTDSGGLQLYEMYDVEAIGYNMYVADSLLHSKLIAGQKVSGHTRPAPKTKDSSLQALLAEKAAEREMISVNSQLRDSIAHPIFSVLKMSDLPANDDARHYTNSHEQVGFVFSHDTAILNRRLKDPLAVALMPGNLEFMYGRSDDQETGNILLTLYAVRKSGPKPLLDETYITEARLEPTNRSYETQIYFQFNKTGSLIWEKMTEANIGKSIGIVTNHTVLSAPHVNEPIAGGSCVISMGQSGDESRQLSIMMQSGAFRAPVTVQNLSFSPTGIYAYSWLKYLIIGLVSFVIFFFLVLFIDRVIQNAFKSSRPQSLASGE